MFSFLRSLFFRKTAQQFVSPRSPNDPVFPPEVEHDDFMRECAMRAIRSGNVVFGNSDADGRVTISESPD